MAPERGSWQRLHPATLLFDVGRRFLTLAFWAVTVLFFAARSQEAWYLLFLLPPVVNALLRYASFRYSLTEDHLIVREGILVRKVRHVPFARIQNIDTLQGPLHRLLGVVEVRLETAGGSEPEALFRVISNAELVRLRAGLAGPRPALPAGAGVAAHEAEPFFRMRNADVLLFGLLSQKGLIYVLGLLVALREFAESDRVAELLRAGFEALDIEARSFGTLAGLALAGSFLLLLQLLTVLWSFVTLYGFRIERKDEDLRTTCGLFTRQTATLPRARVQFLQVSQGPFHRLFDRVAIRASSAGGDSTEDSQVARKWLVPLAPRSELGRILDEVQPEAAFEGLRWEPVHPRAPRRVFVKWMLLLSVPVALAAQRSWWLAAGVMLLGAGLGLVFARLRVRALGCGVGERAVFLRDGVLTRRFSCVRFEKVQSVVLSQTPFDRRHRMARVSIDTAGASGTRMRLVVPFLGLRQAIRLHRHLQGEAAAVSFRW